MKLPSSTHVWRLRSELAKLITRVGAPPHIANFTVGQQRSLGAWHDAVRMPEQRLAPADCDPELMVRNQLDDASFNKSQSSEHVVEKPASTLYLPIGVAVVVHPKTCTDNLS